MNDRTVNWRTTRGRRIAAVMHRGLSDQEAAKVLGVKRASAAAYRCAFQRRQKAAIKTLNGGLGVAIGELTARRDLIVREKEMIDAAIDALIRLNK